MDFCLVFFNIGREALFLIIQRDWLRFESHKLQIQMPVFKKLISDNKTRREILHTVQMWSALWGWRKYKLQLVTPVILPCGIYYTPQPYQTLHVFNMSTTRFTEYSFQQKQNLGPELDFSELSSLPLLKTPDTEDDRMSEKLTTGEKILEETWWYRFLVGEWYRNKRLSSLGTC